MTPKLIVIGFLLISGIVGTSFSLRNRMQWVTAVSAWIFVGTIAISFIFGIGFHWSTWSLIGKILATGMSTACIVIGTVSGILLVRRKSSARVLQTIGGIVGGIIGLLTCPYVGLLTACILTGDCL